MKRFNQFILISWKRSHERHRRCITQKNKPIFCSGLLSEFAAHVVSFFILQEIEHLTHLEQYTLSSDLSQGYALKMLAGKWKIKRIKPSSVLRVSVQLNQSLQGRNIFVHLFLWLYL